MNGAYHTSIKKCRLCGGEGLREIYHCASLPVGGIYYGENEDEKNVTSPITLVRCDSCGHFQLGETINPEIYADYSFAGSQNPSYDSHLRTLAERLVNEFGVKNGRVYEVGASDGALLKYLREMGNNEVSGIEPSGQLCEMAEKSGVSVLQGYFDGKFVESAEMGLFDCVIIRHVIEHIDNLHDVASSLEKILKDDGILVVETPDVEKMFQNQSYSNIFHEHLNYFSFSTLSRLFSMAGLQAASRSEVDIHGGSMLVFFRKGSETPQNIEPEIDMEKALDFAGRAGNYFGEIGKAIRAMSRSGKTVHGYGASHRTWVILGNSGIGRREIPIIYDMNRILWNKRLNGLGSLALPVEKVSEYNPDAIMILAISYEKEIAYSLRNRFGYQGEIYSLKSAPPERMPRDD